MIMQFELKSNAGTEQDFYFSSFIWNSFTSENILSLRTGR